MLAYQPSRKFRKASKCSSEVSHGWVKQRYHQDTAGSNEDSAMCRLCNKSYFGECVKHLNVRVGEHIDIPPFTEKQVTPKNRYVANHLP